MKDEKKLIAESEAKAKKAAQEKAAILAGQIKQFLGKEFMVIRVKHINEVLGYLQKGTWKETNDLIQGLLEDDKMPVNSKK